jgi:hypothetical protein
MSHKFKTKWYERFEVGGKSKETFFSVRARRNVQVNFKRYCKIEVWHMSCLSEQQCDKFVVSKSDWIAKLFSIFSADG